MVAAVRYPIRATLAAGWATAATTVPKKTRTVAAVLTPIRVRRIERSLLLDRAGGQAGGELRLEREEEEEGRQRDQGRGRHHLPPLGGVLAEERVEGERHRLHLGLGQERQREEVL